VYAELDGTNQLIARYLHGDEFDQTFARVDLRAANASERVQWYLTDHLNSVRLVLDETGAVLDQIAYDAFGNIVAQLNPLLVNPILFTSREFDAETGLYYNRARYLDPSTGRWTTQDPMGFAAGDANLYRYVGNRATLATDPSGNLAWFVAVPLVMSVGGFTWLTGSTALTAYRTTGSWWDAGTWGACWDGLRLGIQANVNGLASAARSLLTLGVWNEPWEVWAVADEDRPYYDNGFMFARFGWELLPTAGIGRLTQAPGQMGRWGRWALGWDAGQNAVQAGRGGWDISQHGLTWTNGLQVVGSLLGLGGNYTTWRRLPAGGAPARTPAPAPSTPTTPAAVSTETVAPRPPTAAPSTPTTRAAAAETETAARPPTAAPTTPTTRAAAADEAATAVAPKTPPSYSSLPERGGVLGRGAEGTVFELHGHPEWVLKEFHPGTVATQASNEAANLARLRSVFGDRHVVRVIEPPIRFAPGERVVLLKERVFPTNANPDYAARDRIVQTLQERGMANVDVGRNLIWGTTAGDPTPRWIWIE
jgi:RHS repeat-associated protein